ncbi:glycosyltransferase [Aliarcobacter cryaerophilus]|uniref:glycosyltransferase n=1 Tax=Aliarcobacter cryaerophilus TaxID=28198 RepID=UPI0021B56401|nr:glycosyltransferase [Aliarcobacter cryaerophilus]MCT7528308.1 glycosyltransferase [Aliarcobacter cryaerophilus]
MNQSNLLPIIIFAYNRPDHLKLTLDSLKKAHLSEQSIIYFFSDAAKNDLDILKVNQVRAIINKTTGFFKKHIVFQEVNQGLAKSVINGVSTIISEYKGVIVLEDDIVVNKYFLQFMNKAFNQYSSHEKIGTITGYSPPVTFENYPYDILFSTRSSTWGWAMSKENWESIIWEKDYYNKLSTNKTFLKNLAKAGNDREKILKGYLEGRLNIWGIRRGAWQIINNKYTLYPKHSMLYNIGLDGSGINCGIRDDNTLNYNAFFNPNNFPTDIEINIDTEKTIKNFYDLRKG